MIFYNSLLAKWFLGKGKKHYFMLGWFFFTRYKYLEVWEDMELRIHARQYWECFSLTLIPALILSLLFSWWWMVLPFVTVITYFIGLKRSSVTILSLIGRRWNIVAIRFI